MSSLKWFSRFLRCILTVQVILTFLHLGCLIYRNHCSCSISTEVKHVMRCRKNSNKYQNVIIIDAFKCVAWLRNTKMGNVWSVHFMTYSTWLKCWPALQKTRGILFQCDVSYDALCFPCSLTDRLTATHFQWSSLNQSCFIRSCSSLLAALCSDVTFLNWRKPLPP